MKNLKKKSKITKNFGKRITRESTLPLIVESCILFLEKKGKNTPSLFRIPVNEEMKLKMYSIAQKGKLDALSTNVEGVVHAVADIVKDYYKMLPEPIITIDYFYPIISVLSDDDREPEEKLDDMKSLLQTLPKGNYTILESLIGILWTLAVDERTKNEAEVDSLSKLFSPYILPSIDSLENFNTENVLHIFTIVRYFISEFPFFFLGAGLTANSENGTVFGTLRKKAKKKKVKGLEALAAFDWEEKEENPLISIIEQKTPRSLFRTNTDQTDILRESLGFGKGVSIFSAIESELQTFLTDTYGGYDQIPYQNLRGFDLFENLNQENSLRVSVSNMDDSVDASADDSSNNEENEAANLIDFLREYLLFAHESIDFGGDLMGSFYQNTAIVLKKFLVSAQTCKKTKLPRRVSSSLLQQLESILASTDEKKKFEDIKARFMENYNESINFLDEISENFSSVSSDKQDNCIALLRSLKKFTDEIMRVVLAHEEYISHKNLLEDPRLITIKTEFDAYVDECKHYINTIKECLSDVSIMTNFNSISYIPRMVRGVIQLINLQQAEFEIQVNNLDEIFTSNPSISIKTEVPDKTTQVIAVTLRMLDKWEQSLNVFQSEIIEAIQSYDTSSALQTLSLNCQVVSQIIEYLSPVRQHLLKSFREFKEIYEKVGDSISSLIEMINEVKNSLNIITGIGECKYISELVKELNRVSNDPLNFRGGKHFLLNRTDSTSFSAEQLTRLSKSISVSLDLAESNIKQNFAKRLKESFKDCDHIAASTLLEAGTYLLQLLETGLLAMKNEVKITVMEEGEPFVDIFDTIEYFKRLLKREINSKKLVIIYLTVKATYTILQNMRQPNIHQLELEKIQSIQQFNIPEDKVIQLKAASLLKAEEVIHLLKRVQTLISNNDFSITELAPIKYAEESCMKVLQAGQDLINT